MILLLCTSITQSLHYTCVKLLSGYETHRNKDRNITKKRTTNVFTECEFIKQRIQMIPGDIPQSIRNKRPILIKGDKRKQ